MNPEQFLLLMTLFCGIMTILKYTLSPKNAIKINTWYSILDKENHDFKILLEREKKFFPTITLISLGGYILTLLTNDILGNVFVGIIFLCLFFYIFYARPPKIKT